MHAGAFSLCPGQKHPYPPAPPDSIKSRSHPPTPLHHGPHTGTARCCLLVPPSLSLSLTHSLYLSLCVSAQVFAHRNQVSGQLNSVLLVAVAQWEEQSEKKKKQREKSRAREGEQRQTHCTNWICAVQINGSVQVTQCVQIIGVALRQNDGAVQICLGVVGLQLYAPAHGKEVKTCETPLAKNTGANHSVLVHVEALQFSCRPQQQTEDGSGKAVSGAHYLDKFLGKVMLAE